MLILLFTFTLMIALIPLKKPADPKINFFSENIGFSLKRHCHCHGLSFLLIHPIVLGHQPFYLRDGRGGLEDFQRVWTYGVAYQQEPELRFQARLTGGG